MAAKVAVVTGSNQGIGFAIVKELLQRKAGIVYLTSRNIARGKEAVEKLETEGLHPEFHQLEVTDKESVKALAKHLKDKHGGLDILINNAGVITKNFFETTYEDASQVLEVNYKSILTIQEILFPILNENARVINVSSDCGHIANLRNKSWIDRLTKKDIKLEDVDAFVNWFLESVKNNTLKDEDFAQTPMLSYRISKVALCALTRVQQNEIDRNISINALHPGFVETRMTKNVGFLKLEESGKTPAYLALDAPQDLKGSYIWFDKKIIDWTDSNSDLYCHFEYVEKSLKDAGHL